MSRWSAIRRLTIKRASRKSVGRGSIGLRATPARQKGLVKDRHPAGTAVASLKRLREPSLQELSQLRRSLELRNRGEFLERRRERIRETPDGSRPGTPRTSVLMQSVLLRRVMPLETLLAVIFEIFYPA
jgi:hypothetical protein